MSNDIIIKEVTGRSMLRKFVDYPNRLYRDTPQFVPAFYGDDLSDWNRKKNPAFKYCDARAFLAYRDGRIVGRIGAIYSRRSNELWGTNRLRFTQVDFIDDPAVSSALFETVEKWAAELGCSQVHGPLGFCDMDREGMLVEGYDIRSMFITYYNHPYYNEHLARLGYAKDVDWIEYKLPTPSEDDRFYKLISKLSERALAGGTYHKVNIRYHREFKPYIPKVFELVNKAYKDLYSVVDLNQEQIDKYAAKFVPLISPDYCALVVDDNDELVAFGVCAPSMAKAMQKHRGRLFPTGWASVLHSLKKNNAVDLLLMAVRPDLQGTGLNAVVVDHIMKGCMKNGIEYAETGPQLELNRKMITQWKVLNPVPHKRRRCYIKNLA